MIIRFNLDGPFDSGHDLCGQVEDRIAEVIRTFHEKVDAAISESLRQRAENGWKAEPVIYSFYTQPFRKCIRIVENGHVVFEWDVVLRLQSS